MLTVCEKIWDIHPHKRIQRESCAFIAGNDGCDHVSIRTSGEQLSIGYGCGILMKLRMVSSIFTQVNFVKNKINIREKCWTYIRIVLLFVFFMGISEQSHVLKV